MLGAVLEHVTRGQLGQGRGFTHAGRADQGNHPALLQRLLLRRFNRTRQVGEQHAPGLARLGDSRHALEQHPRQLGGQAHALQAPPEIGLLRPARLHLPPGHGTQLAFEQLAQAVQLGAHGLQRTLVVARHGCRRGHA
ncbi:hypothetical protein D3C80_1241930 [compost metagenome]